jgi:Mg-chelatase subunit ChlD
MAVVTDPLVPWHIIIAGLAVGTVVLLLFRSVGARRYMLGRTRWTRLGVLVLSSLAVALLTAAACDPRYGRRLDLGSVHLAVVVDVSDSVLRSEGGWRSIQARACQFVASSVAATPARVREQGTASILTFGKGAIVAEREIPLMDLPNALGELNQDYFAPGEESDIETGLTWAGDLIERAGSRGAILLISDGHETVNDALEGARQLARKGIAVHVHPVEGRGPELTIAAADLPRQVDAGAETFVRGTLWNGSASTASARLTMARNPGLEDVSRFGEALVSETEVSLPAGNWARFRQPVTFQGPGLQYVELVLAQSVKGIQHRRLLFTHVNQPHKILVIGGDTRWVAVLSSSEITQIHPQALSETKLNLYDAIVISGVPAHQFTDAALGAIAGAVEQEGVGLMVINGDHQGADEGTETVLMSYDETTIEPLLPVRADDASHFDRQVVMLIDASSSMEGTPIATAKMIARHIVQNLLGPTDRLDIISFTVDANHLMDSRVMDGEGQREAVERIDAIAASGGTDPSLALALIADRRMSKCNLILISDGYFDTVSQRSDCQATVFAIGHDSVPSDSPLWEFAEPIPAPPSFDPWRIKITSLQPSQEAFAQGSFLPRALGQSLRRDDDLPVPEIAMEGTATVYVKEDADLVAVRPKLATPVLAYRDHGAGHVGALTTGLPPTWLENAAGREAIEAWITHVMPCEDRERYDFQVADQGESIAIQVALAAKEGRVPAVERLEAAIQVQGEAPDTRRLQADRVAPATFGGHLPVPPGAREQQATLIIKESGPDALSRPQCIPILLPEPQPWARTGAALPAGEAHSYGLNRSLLQEIADSSGGIYDPPNGASLFQVGAIESRGEPIWPFLVVLAVACYFGAIALRRLDL